MNDLIEVNFEHLGSQTEFRFYSNEFLCDARINDFGLCELGYDS